MWPKQGGLPINQPKVVTGGVWGIYGDLAKHVEPKTCSLPQIQDPMAIWPFIWLTARECWSWTNQRQYFGVGNSKQTFDNAGTIRQTSTSFRIGLGSSSSKSFCDLAFRRAIAFTKLSLLIATGVTLWFQNSPLMVATSELLGRCIQPQSQSGLPRHHVQTVVDLISCRAPKSFSGNYLPLTTALAPAIPKLPAHRPVRLRAGEG
jgi:hypothetical protein